MRRRRDFYSANETGVTLTCKVCGEPFLYSDGEAAWMREMGFHQPRCCKPCRAAKKAARTAQRVDTHA